MTNRHERRAAAVRTRGQAPDREPLSVAIPEAPRQSRDERRAETAHMRGQVPNREPLAVTVPEAARLSGYSEGTIWSFIQKKKLEAIRAEGHRRTLVSFPSLKRLLDPANSAPAGAWGYPNPRGKPRRRPAEQDAQALEAEA
jgi:hypothetical protein